MFISVNLSKGIICHLSILRYWKWASSHCKPSPLLDFLSNQVPSHFSLFFTCCNIHHQDMMLKPGGGLSCYQCRSDEIAECGDPFISSRFDHYGRHDHSHQNCHLCNDAVMTSECVGSQGRSAMCSTPSQAASATKPPSLVGLNLHTF